MRDVLPWTPRGVNRPLGLEVCGFQSSNGREQENGRPDLHKEWAGS